MGLDPGAGKDTQTIVDRAPEWGPIYKKIAEYGAAKESRASTEWSIKWN